MRIRKNGFDSIDNYTIESIYIDKLCNNSTDYHSVAYDKNNNRLVMFQPNVSFVFYIKDLNNNLINLNDNDIIAIHEKYLSIHFVCNQERKEDLNPNVKAEYEIDLTNYFMPNLISIYDNNYNVKNDLSKNNIKLTSIVNLKNTTNIVDDLGHEYVVKLYYHNKLLTPPNYWKKIQSNLFISHKINDLPACVKIDNSNIKFNEILVVQNFIDLLFFENYKDKEEIKELTTFYACNIPHRVIAINKYPVLQYVETLKSASRQNILKIQNIKKMNEINKIDYSIAVNNLIKSIENKNL